MSSTEVSESNPQKEGPEKPQQALDAEHDHLPQPVDQASAESTTKPSFPPSADASAGSTSSESPKVGGAQVPVTEVVGSNGISVRCSYLDHPAFKSTSNLCLTIHYAVVKLAPYRHSGWSQSLFTAIKYFLDFLIGYNAAHQSLGNISHIKDITPSIFKSFMLYLSKTGKNQANAFRIKSMLSLAARETENVPILDLPSVTVRVEEPSEPLYEDGLLSLKAAGMMIVDQARQKIENRKTIDQAEPYTFEEINEMRLSRRTDEDLFGWYKYRLENNLAITTDVLRTKIENAVNPEVRSLIGRKNIKQPFHDLYERIGKDVEIPPEYYTAGKATGKPLYYQIILDPYRVVKTLIAYDFPFNYSIEELENSYSYKSLNSASACEDVIQLIHHKLYKTRDYQIRKGLPHSLSLDEHLALYYPTATDAAGIALLLMVQAGWNKETVMDLDKDNYVHGLTNIIESDLKIIWSEKYRSQGLEKPYAAPKRMLAQTNSSDPYSSYNLIQLAKELTAPIAHCTFGQIDRMKNRPVNSMFAFVRARMGWIKGGPVSTLDFDLNFSLAVASFLKKYEVIDNGTRLTSAKSLTRRLRATWMFYNSENTPFAFLTQLLGHEYRDTTDEHYDSSPAANARRFKRLRESLEEVIDLLRARKFKGILGAPQQHASRLRLAVFHLPFLERALWACKDRTLPDWKGAPTLADGALCDALDKCLFCSQVWILKDSLPYLVERLKHVEDQIYDHNSSMLSSSLEDERKTIETILESWPDQNAIKEAVRYRALNSPLLPREMRDLKLIFRSSSLEA